MTLTIDLTPDDGSRLAAGAAGAGLDTVSYVRSLIGKVLLRGAHKPLTGRALVEKLTREAVSGSGFGDPSVDSPEAARDLRLQVWRTRQADPSK